MHMPDTIVNWVIAAHRSTALVTTLTMIESSPRLSSIHCSTPSDNSFSAMSIRFGPTNSLNGQPSGVGDASVAELC